MAVHLAALPGPLTLTLTLTLAVVAVVAVVLARLLLALVLFARRLGQHAGVMLGVLEEALLGHAVARKLGVAGERKVFLDDLLGGAADLAFGAGAVEHAVDDIAKRALAAGLVTRTGFG